MPRSKKGRLSGPARIEINERRGADAITRLLSPKKSDPPIDFVVGRVVKHTGANHVRVAIDSKRGAKELLARIPNYLTKRGATPITTRSLAIIYTGEDYDPNEPAEAGEHFDIISLLTNRQVNDLVRAGTLPHWMTSTDSEESSAAATESAGFMWEDSRLADVAEEDETAGAGAAAAGFSRGASRIAATAAASDDDFDIDDI